MAALDFPSSPTTGQIFTGPNGAVWSWDGTKWISATSGNLYSAINNVGRNLIHNGLFNVAQRGAGPWTVTNAYQYTVDRWAVRSFGAADTSTISCATLIDADRTAIGDESAKISLSNNFTGSTATGAGLYAEQRMEDVRRLAGKTVTVSFWAKASAALKLGINMYQTTGTGGSPPLVTVLTTGAAASLTTAWARYTVSIAVPSLAGKTVGTAGDDYAHLRFWYSVGATSNVEAGNIGQQNGTIAIWGVQLEAGSTATPLEKLDPQQDLAKCQRFFYSGAFWFVGYGAAGSTIGGSLPYPVPLRAAPGTVAITSPVYTNASGGTVTTIGHQLAAFPYVVTAAGTAYFSGGFTASADL